MDRKERAEKIVELIRADMQKGAVCDSVFKCDGWKELQKRIDQCRKLPNKHMNNIGDLLSSIRGTFSFCPYCGKESKVIEMRGVGDG